MKIKFVLIAIVLLAINTKVQSQNVDTTKTTLLNELLIKEQKNYQVNYLAIPDCCPTGLLYVNYGHGSRSCPWEIVYSLPVNLKKRLNNLMVMSSGLPGMKPVVGTLITTFCYFITSSNNAPT
jgi:hypothetical protein